MSNNYSAPEPFAGGDGEGVHCPLLKPLPAVSHAVESLAWESNSGLTTKCYGCI